MNRVGVGEQTGQDDAAPSVADGARSPFAETASSDVYVARDATEEALRRLESAATRGTPCMLLTGPPGLGKTLLLRVLEDRMRGRLRPIHLAYGALPLVDLCVWMLGLLDEAPGPDPVDRVRGLARAAASEGGGLLILVDDANSLPVDTSRALGELVRSSQGAIQIVLASTDDAQTSRVVAALGLEVVAHRFDRPMTADETHRYITARLRQARAHPGVWRILGPERVRRLHALSAGIPRRLHVLATELLRGQDGERVLAQLEPEWADLLIHAEDTPADEDRLSLFSSRSRGERRSLEALDLDPGSDPAPAAAPDAESARGPVAHLRPDPSPTEVSGAVSGADPDVETGPAECADAPSDRPVPAPLPGSSPGADPVEDPGPPPRPEGPSPPRTGPPGPPSPPYRPGRLRARMRRRQRR